MKFIELHFGSKYALNVDYIVAVNPKTNGGCEIFTVGDKAGDSWNSDESYEEVMRMIREASDG